MALSSFLHHPLVPPAIPSKALSSTNIWRSPGSLDSIGNASPEIRYLFLKIEMIYHFFGWVSAFPHLSGEGLQILSELLPPPPSPPAASDYALNYELQISVGSAGLQPRAPDVSGHCRTSTASARCQWALPDLNGEHQNSDIECHKECQIESQNNRTYVRQNAKYFPLYQL